MKMPTLNIVVLSLCSLFASPTFAYTPPEQSEADFQKWVSGFKKQAIQNGISAATVQKAFHDVHLNRAVLELDRRQPEFSKTFWQYFNRAVTEWRIETGKMLYEKHRKQLDEVTAKYGVPGRFLIAFWGMETNFGGYTGNTAIIESLATLSYDPRRSEFFSKELLAALKIIDLGHASVEQMKGSWAGAMGQCQFMPSNYLRYAVDGDESGKKDLWKSLPDVFNSMGNFLAELGWQKQENWGREVSLPAGFDLSLADNKTEKLLTDWKALGIQLADGRELPIEDLKARLVLPSDYRGPAFLVFDNYQVIKRWNRSDNYALAVGHLADRIVGRPPLTKTAPADDQALTREEMKEVQERLNLLGFDLGTPDGIAGSKTRAAIRNYQISRQLPADAYPTPALLYNLRKHK
ncbi:lytic murein transglycosylase [Thiosulfativibrio zosterae]|uniref:Lytic transglycosylase n=1 Tax=Thiosulfativibrio zosterae TaxID=2675053 RepID=A0A6F8PL45_9GAMM|nr:lytic murein transglycosylase [Thiosulfativibrio zosterae]BBP42833.1 lytic transglycosylase [Thiosulfativibrio zosterae]